MKTVASECGTHSTLYKQHKDLLAQISTLLENIFQELTQVKQGCDDLKKIQAPSTVQSRTPQLQRSSYSNIQAFSDKNPGYNDNKEHEIVYDHLRWGNLTQMSSAITIYNFTH